MSRISFSSASISSRPQFPGIYLAYTIFFSCLYFELQIKSHIIGNVQKIYFECTFFESTYWSRKWSPISLNRGRLFQQVRKVHEPDTPWHRHFRYKRSLTACGLIEVFKIWYTFIVLYSRKTIFYISKWLIKSTY